MEQKLAQTPEYFYNMLSYAVKNDTDSHAVFTRDGEQWLHTLMEEKVISLVAGFLRLPMEQPEPKKSGLFTLVEKEYQKNPDRIRESMLCGMLLVSGDTNCEESTRLIIQTLDTKFNSFSPKEKEEYVRIFIIPLIKRIIIAYVSKVSAAKTANDN